MKNEKQKKTGIIVVCVVAVIAAVAVIIAISKGGSNNERGMPTYPEVLSICIRAINENDKDLLDTVVLKALGEEWNEEAIYEPFSEWHDEELWEYVQEYLPLSTETEDSQTFSTQSQLEAVKNYILNETGVSVSDDEVKKIKGIEEVVVVRLASESEAEIGMIKVKDFWYVLYMDMSL